MKPLVSGFSDSLNIMAFKWKGLRTLPQKIWLFVIFAFAAGLLLASAFTGSVFRVAMTTPLNGTSGVQDALVIWINVFLANNASLAAGGVLWALVASILIIPLVGYSFSSVIPEGDLASIKITDNHKIADSIFLQFVSTISFVQVMVLTCLTSIFTIGSDAPGLGIVFSWVIWVIAVLITVLAAWCFEFLHRRFGLISKLIIFGVLGGTAGSLYLMFPDTFISFFGVGEAYTLFIQEMSFANFLPFLIGIGIALAAIVAILFSISVVASNTLKKAERPKKRNTNRVLIARLGLEDKNKVSSLTQFLANMILRQNNIWKPLALSSVFAVGMAVSFYAFYDVLLTVSTLIPIMISLVWAINVFGIIGSGTTWLVSLPGGKKGILSSVTKIQYIIIAAISFITVGLVFLIYPSNITVFVNFLLATALTSAVITQFSLNKAVYSPFRYRVHIRGESVLPPNKAFSYMIQLFILGFAISGLSYGIYGGILMVTQGEVWLALIGQLVLTILGCLLVRFRYLNLRRNWLSDPEIVQNIIKTVGQN
jgi:hypothetical protein